MANLGKAGALMDILQPFAALYVLILAILGPLLTKESKRIYQLLNAVLPLERGSIKQPPANQSDS